MKTLNFDKEVLKPDYEIPVTRKLGQGSVFEGFVVLKIEEFNLRVMGEIVRSYRIHWKNKEGNLKYFDCALNSGVYQRFVIPNMARCTILR